MMFDEKRFFLGSICKRKHDWNETGYSLRTIKKSECVECKSVATQEWRKRNPEKTKIQRGKYNSKESVKEYKRNHHQKNAEKYKQSKRQRYEENKVEHLAKCKAYYFENRDEILQYYRKYQTENRDRLFEYRRVYYQENRDQIAKQCKVYRKKNQDIIRERRKRYRATPRHKLLHKAAENRRRTRKQNNHQFAYSFDSLMSRVKDFNGDCAYCEKKLNLMTNRGLVWDHFIAISKGGSDCIGNLVPACDSCNASKRDSDPWLWYQSVDCFSQAKWKKILKVLGKNQDNYWQIPLF